MTRVLSDLNQIIFTIASETTDSTVATIPVNTLGMDANGNLLIRIRQNNLWPNMFEAVTDPALRKVSDLPGSTVVSGIIFRTATVDLEPLAIADGAYSAGAPAKTIRIRVSSVYEKVISLDQTQENFTGNYSLGSCNYLAFGHRYFFSIVMNPALAYQGTPKFQWRDFKACRLLLL